MRIFLCVLVTRVVGLNLGRALEAQFDEVSWFRNTEHQFLLPWLEGWVLKLVAGEVPWPSSGVTECCPFPLSLSLIDVSFRRSILVPGKKSKRRKELRVTYRQQLSRCLDNGVQFLATIWLWCSPEMKGLHKRNKSKKSLEVRKKRKEGRQTSVCG